MSAVEGELRQALSEALKADAAVQAVLGEPVRLFETRSRQAAFPHASWGRSELRDRSADGAELIEMRLNLEIWCRDDPAEPVLAAMRAAVRDLAVTLPDPAVLISLVPAYGDVFRTREPRVRRGLLRLKALIGREI